MIALQAEETQIECLGLVRRRIVKLALFLFIINPVVVYFRRNIQIIDDLMKMNLIFYVLTALILRKYLVRIPISLVRLTFLFFIFSGIVLGPLLTSAVDLAQFRNYYFSFLGSIVLYLIMGVVFYRVIHDRVFVETVLIVYQALVIALIIYDLLNSPNIVLTNIRFGFKSTLQVADMLVIITTLSLDALSRLRRVIFGISCGVLLLLLSSFTSLLVYIIVIAFYLVSGILTKGTKRSRMISVSKLNVVIIILFVVSVLILQVFVEGSLINLSFHRVSRRIENIMTLQDSSLVKRNEQLFEGLNSIKQHFFLGKWLYYQSSYGSTGNYIHNILSWWAEYGLLTFLSIIGLLLIEFSRLFFDVFLRGRSSELGSLSALAAVVLSITLSRSHQYFFLWFVVGFLSFSTINERDDAKL